MPYFFLMNAGTGSFRSSVPVYGRSGAQCGAVAPIDDPWTPAPTRITNTPHTAHNNRSRGESARSPAGQTSGARADLRPHLHELRRMPRGGSEIAQKSDFPVEFAGSAASAACRPFRWVWSGS